MLLDETALWQTVAVPLLTVLERGASPSLVPPTLPTRPSGTSVFLLLFF